jgi:hypothetical protein
MESSTLVGHLSQPLILLLSVVTTTCLVRHTKPLATLLLTFMAAGVIILIDVPFVLVGALEDMVLSVTSPSQGGYSVWVAWMNFLNGGGRLALAFAAALSVAAASEIGSRPSAVGGIRGGESVIEIPRSQRARLK